MGRPPRLSGRRQGAWNPTPCLLVVDRPRDLLGFRACWWESCRGQSTPERTPHPPVAVVGRSRVARGSGFRAPPAAHDGSTVRPERTPSRRRPTRPRGACPQPCPHDILAAPRPRVAPAPCRQDPLMRASPRLGTREGDDASGHARAIHNGGEVGSARSATDSWMEICCGLGGRCGRGDRARRRLPTPDVRLAGFSGARALPIPSVPPPRQVSRIDLDSAAAPGNGDRRAWHRWYRR